MSMGGWALGPGKEEHSPEEDEEENMDWDEAQEMVEQLVGLGIKPDGASAAAAGQQAQTQAQQVQDARRRAQQQQPVEGYNV